MTHRTPHQRAKPGEVFAWLGRVLGCVAFVLLGIWMASDDEWFGWVLIVLFGAMAIVTLVYPFRNGGDSGGSFGGFSGADFSGFGGDSGGGGGDGGGGSC